jgi:hypothetical protein
LAKTAFNYHGLVGLNIAEADTGLGKVRHEQGMAVRAQLIYYGFNRQHHIARQPEGIILPCETP